MTGRFLVLGASGLVGRHVADMLEEGGQRVMRATRNPAGGNEVYLDLLNPRSFAAALEGVAAVMLMSRPGDEDAHEHTAPFVEAMRRAGVRRVVVLSALGAEHRPASSHRRVEVLVERSGLGFTHVRPNFFMQALARPPLATEVAMRRTLSLPLADAAVAYVDARDAAAVVHRALVDESLDGRAIAVSGPEALDHGRIARSISEAIGASVRYMPIDEAESRALMLLRGLTEAHVARVQAFHRLVREGFCSQPDGHVAGLPSRPLRNWAGFVREYGAVWR
jgi:uncharacterized protein YbjT (DUF2867 family)